MNKYSIVLFVSSITWLFLGIKTLLNDLKNKINILFCLICISIVIFHTFLGIGFLQETNKNVFILAKAAYFGFYFFFPLNLHFYLVISKTNTSSRLLVLAYMPAVIFNIAGIIGRSMFKDIVKYQDVWIGIYNYNLWFYAYTFYAVLLVLISLLVLYKWGKKTSIKKEKIYSKIILIIFAFFYFIGLLVTVVFPMFSIYSLQGIGQILFYIYFFGLYFLISKFRFMDVNYSLMAHEILSNIKEMVIFIDLRYNIIMMNRSASELLAIHTESLTGASFFDFIHSGENIEEKLKNLTNGTESSSQIRIFYKKGKDTLLTDSHLSKVIDKFNDTVGILVISREIKGKKDFQKSYRITDREFEVMDLIISGHSYKTISRILQISERTVETHCLHIYNKLGIGNRVELINLAVKFNLLP